MERFLIFIKHHLILLWTIFEWCNDVIFKILYEKRMLVILAGIFKEFDTSSYQFRKLNNADVELLYHMIQSQNPSDLEFFKPHSFDIRSLRKQMKKTSFLMMGMFNNEVLVGYFFLRFFINGKCFVGRLIDKPYRGLGLGSMMNNVMYEIAWRMNFRCLSTISRNNRAIMRAHAKNRYMVVLKELQNDYLLVEFKRPIDDSKKTF